MYSYCEVTLNENYPDQWFLCDYLVNGNQAPVPMWFFAQGSYTSVKTLSMQIYEDTIRRLNWHHGERLVPIIDYPVWELIAPIIQDDVQAIPCEVEGVKEKFILLNLLNEIDCIDDKKSKIDWPDEKQLEFDRKNSPDNVRKYKTVWNLHIDPARVGDHKLFWTKHWPAQIIRNDVRDAFLAAGFKGPSFIPV